VELKTEIAKVKALASEAKIQTQDVKIKTSEIKTLEEEIKIKLADVTALEIEIKGEQDQMKTFVHQSLGEIILSHPSSIITTNHFKKLLEWIPKPPQLNHLNTCKLELLYKGSVDGFKSENFHEKCDNKSPTISFMKSSEYGRIFGGYTEQNWQINEKLRNDPNAFLFSLTFNEKYPIHKPSHAIFTSCLNLMSYVDVCIYDNCNVESKSWTKFPGSYHCSKFGSGSTDESHAYLAGADKFQIEEIESYHIVWI